MNNDEFQAVRAVCARNGWPAPRIIARTGSTNADLLGTSGHGQVLVAHEQTAGRGRLDRAWVSRPGDGLTFSVRLDVPAQVDSWGWIPLLAGVAVAEAVTQSGAQPIAVKWPNDVLGGDRKLAGILSVRDGSSAIVGIGINLQFAGERPDPNATSVAECGGDPDADALLAGVLAGLAAWWQRWIDAGGDAARCGLQDAYSAGCVTLGAEVTVSAPEREFTGQALEIDEQGRLLVRTADGVTAVTAGDVTLRSAAG